MENDTNHVRADAFSSLYGDDSLLEIPEDAFVERMVSDPEYPKQISRLILPQLQPHFLFNVFSVIYYMCGKNTAEAKSMINDASTFLREDMGALLDPRPVPFEQELSHCRLYLRFEQMRFPDKFRMEYDLAALDFRLPPLTLQPLVENAIRHGLCPLPGGGVVRVESAAEPDAYVVRVIDNGVGFDSSALTADSCGRNNLSLGVIRTRLRTLCGGELTVRSICGEGTICEIRIPKEASK